MFYILVYFLLQPLRNFSMASPLSDEELSAKLNLILYKSSVDDFKTINIYHTNELSEQSGFSPEKKTTLYIGGFKQTPTKAITKEVIESYLSRKDIYNIIQLDWSAVTTENYLKATNALPRVGLIVATGLNKILGTALLKQSNFHIVGHSLGAQLASHIGRNTKVPVAQITGLDPAGPLFDLMLPHLKAGDAEIVVVLHTDAYVYGTALAVADIDFYANGGRREQPGCPILTIPFSLQKGDLCSHQRAVKFWAQAVKNDQLFMAVKRDKRGFLENEVTYMGAVMTGVKGKYYFKTSKNPPYGIGPAGILPYTQKKKNKVLEIIRRKSVGYTNKFFRKK